MTARAGGEGRRNDRRVGCARGEQGSEVEGCFSWKGMAGGLADLAFSKRDESTEVAKTGGERAGASAEWHAWTEPDHACPDERRDTDK